MSTTLSAVSLSSSSLSYIMQVSPGSQVLLDNAERYGIYLARSLNDTNPAEVLSRENIGKFYYREVPVIQIIHTVAVDIFNTTLL